MNPKLLRLIELVLQVNWQHDRIATVHVSGSGIVLQTFKIGQVDTEVFYTDLQNDEVKLQEAIKAVEAILKEGNYIESQRQGLVGVNEG